MHEVDPNQIPRNGIDALIIVNSDFDDEKNYRKYSIMRRIL